MEDSKKALFIEPNAYINYFKPKEKCEVKPIKKVVFSEPYDCMPNFHINNNFHKGDCECVNKKDCNQTNQHDCKPHPPCNKPNLGFDIKNFLPILSSFNKGGFGGLDLNSISSMFNSSGGFDFSKLLSNPQLITSALSLFGGKKKTSTKKEEIISTDYEIKNYTRV